MMPLYEHYELRKKSLENQRVARRLTSEQIIDRAEARRNRHEFWRSANLSFREHQRYLKLGIGLSLVLSAMLLYWLAGR
jgi:hypothetical protein